MKIQLDSDFSDYYDHWFCGRHDVPDYVWQRNAEGGMVRRCQFSLLERVGWTVPMHGTTSRLYEASHYPDNTLAVIYHDEQKHRGEGKELLTLDLAACNYPTALASLFVESTKEFADGTKISSVSRRLLCIGDRMFWLEYSSADDWRSNCGDVTVKVIGETLGRAAYFREAGPEWQPHLLEKYPLWAVDFVTKHGQDHPRYAIDFNSSPGIKGTGLADILPAKEAAKEICDYLIFNWNRRKAIAQ